MAFADRTRSPTGSRANLVRARSRSTVAQVATLSVLTGIALMLAACSNVDGDSRGFSPSFTGTEASARVWDGGGPIPQRRGTYKLGNPYKVAGQTFVPRHDPNYDRTGIASWYGDDFHGRLTANGEIFDKHRLTAAHPTLPLPSLVRVTNLENGRTAILRVNDRGPFLHGRLIDLSHASAVELGFMKRGIARVRVTYLGPADLGG